MLQLWLPEHTHFIGRATLAATLPTRSSLLAEVIRKVIREEIPTVSTITQCGATVWGPRLQTSRLSSEESETDLSTVSMLSFVSVVGLCLQTTETDSG